MAKRRDVERALKVLDDVRQEVAELETDTNVASVKHQGERWGNRRVSPGNYESLFGRSS